MMVTRMKRSKKGKGAGRVKEVTLVSKVPEVRWAIEDGLDPKVKQALKDLREKLVQKANLEGTQTKD